MPATPWGFRDILPEEALVREAVADTVRGVLRRADYLPVETPLLEDKAALEADRRIADTPFKLFDDDWGLLAKHSYTEFGRKAVDVGERFETHGQHFVLREDKDGFLFLEKPFYNPYMKIVSMNHEVRQR